MSETVLQMAADRFKLAEHERNVHSITIEEGVTRAQLINPAFLAHVAAKLRPYDQIEVRCDDGTLFAKLLVLQAERTWARVHVLEWHNLTTRDVSLSQVGEQAKSGAADKAAGPDPARALMPEDDYLVQWKGPHKKWCVIRKADGAYMREAEPDKAAATTWLLDWIKVTA